MELWRTRVCQKNRLCRGSPMAISVSKTAAEPGAPRSRPTLQNPNSWQSTSSNRTARTDASGWPTTKPTSKQNEQPMHVGIDVSKNHLDAHVHETGLAFRVSNDDAGIEQLVERLAGLALQRIVMEATGGYESAAFATLSVRGLPVAVVNPRTRSTSREQRTVWPRPTKWTQLASLSLLQPCSHGLRLCPMRRPRSSTS